MAKNPIAGCSIGNWNRIVRSNAEGVVSKSNNVICWQQLTVGLSVRGQRRREGVYEKNIIINMKFNSPGTSKY